MRKFRPHWPWNPDAPDKSRWREEFQKVAFTLGETLKTSETRGVVFTSPQRREGTSTVLVAVGREMQRAFGTRVLLVELNRQQPCFSERLGLSGPGSVHAFSEGELPLPECVHDARGLRVLPAGGDWAAASVPQIVNRLLQQAEKISDVVLIDAPPILESADASAAASVTKDLVLVVRSGRNSGEMLDQVRRQVDQAGIRIVGSIVTMQRGVVPRWLYQ
jgi:Mrp family chromosome partitioning ATPase